MDPLKGAANRVRSAAEDLRAQVRETRDEVKALSPYANAPVEKGEDTFESAADDHQARVDFGFAGASVRGGEGGVEANAWALPLDVEEGHVHLGSGQPVYTFQLEAGARGAHVEQRKAGEFSQDNSGVTIQEGLHHEERRSFGVADDGLSIHDSKTDSSEDVEDYERSASIGEEGYRQRKVGRSGSDKTVKLGGGPVLVKGAGIDVAAPQANAEVRVDGEVVTPDDVADQARDLFDG
jgi:hypothetical protein